MLNRFICTVMLLVLSCSGAQETGREEEAVKDSTLKVELIEVAKRVYARKLTSGTGGDISVRVPDTDRLIVKATGHCLGDLDYESISTLNLEGEVIGGNPSPSKEAQIHCRVYKLRGTTVNAIMHMHSPYATAWASAGKLISAVTQQSVKLLKDTAIVPYYRVGTEELDNAVVKAFKNPGTEVVMMENHGVFVVGKDLWDLLYKAEVVENTARIAWLCRALGEAKEFEY